jgi:hypothetical protein
VRPRRFRGAAFIALRMALDLADHYFEGTDPEVAYPSATVTFVQKQYDLIRGERAQIAFWFA